MIIASWNINSLRLRVNHIEKLLKSHSPDIICFQETKVRDQEFPFEDIKKFGYEFMAICGEKSYNGVAIISRIPFEDVNTHKFANDACRHVSIKIKSGIEIHNFYVPAGGDIADPEINPKFFNKLQYLDEVTDWFANNRTKNDPMILVGDLNIAPLEHDVWSHKQLLKEVSHTPIEIEKIKKWQDGLSWYDTHRHFTPDDQKLYSWWSYRNRDWRKSNRGRRLDHIWITPILKKNLSYAWILKDARDWESPSDHVPILAEFS